MAEQVTLHTDNRVVAAHERLAEVIEAPVLVERDARPSVGEADVSGYERDAEAGTPEDGADLFFCPPPTPNPVSTMRTQAATHEVGCS